VGPLLLRRSRAKLVVAQRERERDPFFSFLTTVAYSKGLLMTWIRNNERRVFI